MYMFLYIYVCSPVKSKSNECKALIGERRCYSGNKYDFNELFAQNTHTKNHLSYVTTWGNLKGLFQKRMPRIHVTSSSTPTHHLAMEITFKNEFRCWKKKFPISTMRCRVSEQSLDKKKTALKMTTSIIVAFLLVMCKNSQQKNRYIVITLILKMRTIYRPSPNVFVATA